MGNMCSGQSDLASVVAESPEAAAVHGKLVEILTVRPYLTRRVHPLHYWVDKCQLALGQKMIAEAQDHLGRIETAVKVDDKRLRATFHKFDLDRSGELEVEEFTHFVTYVGFGQDMVEEILKDSDKNADRRISFDEFEAFVGRVGGIHALFERRRTQIADKTDAEASNILVGSRVRAFASVEGKRSSSVWDARVLELMDSGSNVRLRMGTGSHVFDQVVSREWIEEDLDLVEALRTIGILDDAQHYWTILLPASEQQVVKSLTRHQTEALFEVRQQSSNNHTEALRDLMERCEVVGISNGELWSVLTWIRDLAPIILMVDLDKVGPFFEKDGFYRNQFETQSSGGLLNLQLRREWERDLFGGCYNEAEPFERPKYGVLDVMNDHRGVVCARQYGDSYFTLKNARLRCTFAPEDSGGIASSRLAVLDQYAHVLMEFSDEELREVSRVANAKMGSEDRIGDSEKLSGYNYKEAQIHGTIDLSKHVRRLVVHPRHRVDGLKQARIRSLCDLYGWDFIWMDDEYDRRIHEERGATDSKVLEMSWQSEDLVQVPKLETNSRTWKSFGTSATE